ncbi:PEST proteolytic signal-containing nuclear protein [Pyxicephalus adspersus]|uniref:PEST proteolytic signal-containing nuclear protein n=1 Tax=Pyxicephalus adspersus TaxID=30357 RepID=UPI003B5AA556
MADQKGRQGGPEEEAENEVQTKTVSSSNGGESSSRNAEKRSADTSSEESSTQPCPAKVSKIGFAVGSQIGKKSSSISIKLGGTKLKDVTPAAVPKKSTVAAVFNDEDDVSRSIFTLIITYYSLMNIQKNSVGWVGRKTFDFFCTNFHFATLTQHATFS